MKKLFILMFCIILLVGTVTAQTNFDNRIRMYNEDIKEYTIDNTFGLGKDIAKIKLTTALEVQVPIGYNKVAEIIINNYDDYTNLFNDMEFFDLNNNNKSFQRSFDYKYKNIIQVPNLEYTCDESILKNGTIIYENCRQEQKGLRDQVEWININIEDELPKGNITIGIFTEVKRGDRVEWIATLYGKRLDEWAIWSAADGMVTYWKLDEGSSPLVDSAGSLDLSEEAGTPTYSLTGKINTAIGIDSGNEGFTNASSSGVSNIDFGTTQDYSFNLWINFTANSVSFPAIFDSNSLTDPRWVILGDTANTKISWRTTTSGPGVTLLTDGDVPMNEFHMISGVRNNSGTDFWLYVDGELNQSLTGQAVQDANANNISLGNPLLSRQLNAIIDEFGIWNRSLNQDEITLLYNNNDACEFGNEGCDAFISITLNSPVDNFATTNPIIIFNGSISSNFNAIVNVSLLLDGVVNETNSSGINGTDYIFTKELSFNSHNWTYESCDNESICFTAPVRDLTVSTFIENNITFNSTPRETSSQDFELNITTIPEILSISAFLNYNGTPHVSTTVCDGSDCTITNTIDIPLVNSGEFENKSFFWEISAFDGTSSASLNSTINEQNVTRIHLEECDATFTTQTLNFTAYDEQNLTRLSAFMFDATFDQWLGRGTIKRQSNFTNSSLPEETLCISPVDETFFIDAIIEYDEDGNESTYTLRNYYFQNDTISNVSQDIFLYLLKSSSSTSFILKVQDDSLLPVSGVLVEINRFYPGTDEFRVVQIAKTDDSGKSVGFFETEIVDYKFFITLNDETLLETGIQKVIPEASPFTLTFNIGDPLGAPWDSQEVIGSLNSTLVWDGTSGFVTYIYIDNSTLLSLARLLVTKQDLTNATNDTIICDENSTLTAATLLCNVGTTNGFYIASAFITRNSSENLDKQITFQVETLSGTVGLLGLFYGWFLILIASFMFKFNEIAGIWAVTITVFLVNIIGLIKFGGLFVTGTIAIAIILTWIMER